MGNRLKSIASAFVLLLVVVSLSMPRASASASATLSGANVRVTTANFATAATFGYGSSVGGPADVLQQNEPSIAVNPVDPSKAAIGVNDVRSLPTSGDAWQSLAFSTDGGAAWSESLVPGFPGDRGCPTISPVCGNGAGSDPYVAFDRSNNLFFAFIAFQRVIAPDEAANAIAVAKYDASGSTAVYQKTVIVERGTIGLGKQEDKEALAVDTNHDSPFKNNIYVSWSRFTGAFDHLYFARSTDHGDSYSQPIKLDEGTPAIQASSIAVAPDGAVFIAYRKFNLNPPPGTPQENAIFVVTSIDGGATFTKPILVQFIGNYAQAASRIPPLFRVSTFPWIAADMNGVYVAWANRNPGSGADIEVRRSKDGGATWEPVVFPHSQAPTLGTNGNGHQIMPAMVAAGGKLSVVWYDSRSEPSFVASGPVSGSGFGATGIGMDVFYAQADTAAPGPLAFQEPIRVTSHSFNPNLDGSILARTPFIGDYIFIAATPTRAFVAWTDNRDINNAGGINGLLFQGGSLPCPAPCPSLPPTLVNQRAVDSNVYFQAIVK